MNDLGLAETVDRLGESIVITVADAAHRRLGGNCSPRAESRTGTNYRAANCQFNSGDRTLALGERDVSFGTLRGCAIVPASWVYEAKDPVHRHGILVKTCPNHRIF